VSFGFGKNNPDHADHPSEYPAVTLSVAKLKGADAMLLAGKITDRLQVLERELIPAEVRVEVTRNYGATASEKVNELLFHLMIAILAVTVLVTLAMGWRGGLVVFLSVPLTFALTLFSYYVLGYTLNRITLFALVFVVGIVVDDSIIIAENMHRHFKSRRLPFREAAIYAINEVGNPTILATFTVIAAILPMAFVSGMMGPYMSPMPIGASIAMLLSLIVALTITPYLGYRLLRANGGNDPDTDGHEEDDGWIRRFYYKVEKPLLDSSRKRWVLLGGTTLVLMAATTMFFTKAVAVKMLPFDNKNEFQLVIDMPEGTTLERTAAVAREFANHISSVPEVVNYQTYVGAASPITFNGLVRHYDLRSGSNMADIQVNLLGKEHRKTQSHDIAKRVRNEVQEIAARTGANVKVVEVPPGPPVLSTIVAEIYGPDYDKQIDVARQVRNILENTPDVVDIDWSVEAPQTEFRLVVDKEKAMHNGIVTQQVVGNVTYLLREEPVTTLRDKHAVNPVPVVMALADGDKAGLESILNLHVQGQHGHTVPLSDLVEVKKEALQHSISRKDQQRVVYVLADMAGDLESPVYAILDMEERLKKNMMLPPGYTISDLYMGQPEDQSNFTVKWDGEWQITLEVFRDLGIAFLVVMLIIYMLIVGWFQDFKTPIIMMIAIPLSLIGIVLGHWLLGAYFTATSFIGMIALAGIMVRNSVLLIDFIEIRLKQGAPIKEAILDAGIVRTTPILLTTGAVIIGAAIILFDPIFQGLAISLVFGAIVSTLLTLLVIPVIYYIAEHRKWAARGNVD
jgi:multidrug efflux pump subunit AcrB